VAFLSGSKKNKNGFHVVVEVRDRSLDLHLLAIEGDKFSALSEVSMSHRIVAEDGLTQEKIKEFSDILNKAFAKLVEATRKKIGDTDRIKIKSSQVVIFYPWFVVEEKNNIQIGSSSVATILSQKNMEEALRNIDTGGLPSAHPVAAYTYKKTIIETVVNSITLNGYIVPEPSGKKSKNIMIGASIYTAAAGILDILKKDVKFHTELEPEIITLPKSLALYINKTVKNNPVLYINVEADNTCITSITPGSSLVYKSKFVDIGEEDIIEKVMEESNTTRDIALSYIRLVHEQALTPEVSALVKSAFDKVVGEWKTLVIKACTELYTQGEKKLVCHNQKMADIFYDAIFGENHEVALLKNIDVEKIVFNSAVGTL